MAVKQLKNAATEQLVISVTFDNVSTPLSATGQKQVVDDQQVATDDGVENQLVISASALANFEAAKKSAADKFADATRKAQDDFDNDAEAAIVALEDQILAENYPDGDFVASVAPVATEQVQDETQVEQPESPIVDTDSRKDNNKDLGINTGSGS